MRAEKIKPDGIFVGLRSQGRRKVFISDTISAIIFRPGFARRENFCNQIKVFSAHVGGADKINPKLYGQGQIADCIDVVQSGGRKRQWRNNRGTSDRKPVELGGPVGNRRGRHYAGENTLDTG
jgi:hypothetical protein